MGWTEVTVLSSRKEFVSLAAREDANISEICRRFGISRKTGYKWLVRVSTEGDSGLEDRSRRPISSPARISADVEKLVLDTRDEHPVWGGRKIRRRLEDLGYANLPAASTITEILRRNNVLDPKESTKHKPWQRFEREIPNELWQMDFKGHFATDTGRCHPLSIIDDHSRYSILLRACADQRGETVKGCLVSAFERYGLPVGMLMDNGSPWAGPRGSYAPLEVWLIRLGVTVHHGRAYHPQTQGKQERFNRTLKAEVVGNRRFRDLDDCQRQFTEWRVIYNHERPHESIGMTVPAKRYQVSPRSYPTSLEPIEYGPQDLVRKVQQDGIIFFKGRELLVGKAFRGYPVAVRATLENGVFDVYFCHQKVRIIDLTNSRSEDMDV